MSTAPHSTAFGISPLREASIIECASTTKRSNPVARVRCAHARAVKAAKRLHAHFDKHEERLPCVHGTCVFMVDSTLSSEVEQNVKNARRWDGNIHVAQITVLDDERGSYGSRTITFNPGAVYLLHHVEYVGIYDGIPKGNVQYERDNIRKVRSPVERRRYLCLVQPITVKHNTGLYMLTDVWACGKDAVQIPQRDASHIVRL
ncbi:hypothetical protein AM587_10003758 [Phytophthora nicotianae]|uniref:Uncharacterized protein n=1 Tax=Phytophthora nicotianae TaxID=4792 RepID=A0A0W8D3K6_PHYNI|nr:hypothetical protein AM587_10003758 [Phytophthora nicotianae]